MSEFFLELFSEEIPSFLQKNLRKDLLNSFIKVFNENSISFKKSFSFSTPNRLVILFEGLQKQVTFKSEQIKGPNVKAPEAALEGFIRSNNINKKDLFKQKIDKGEFYFFKTKSKKLNTQNLLKMFGMIEEEAKSLVEKKISLPAYDQCLKASHIFNILDARGAISVAQRAGYIGRIRDITKAAAGVWLDSQS
jgi:glycyl-tRNA synthetase beta subunit